MKIKVGMACPDMPRTIHKGTHHRSCSQEAFHVQGTHDEAECSSPGDGNSSPSISFLKLYHLFVFRQSKKVLLAASREETNFGLGKQHRMGRHACTGGDPSGNNRVMRRGNPIAGTEQVGHIIAVVQNSQVGLGISMELTTFRQPVYNRSNVFYSMYVSTWNIPNIGRKPPRSGLSWGT